MRTRYAVGLRLIFSVWIVFITTVSLEANVRLAKIFASNMVLQQNTQVNIWGWGDPGEKVAVTCGWDGACEKTVVDDKGKWSVRLRTPEARTDGTSYTITVSGDSTITLTNILIGEVWLLSGQSNIEIPLSGWPEAGAPIENSGQTIASADHPDMRFIIAGRKSASTPQEDFADHWTDATWTPCAPASAAGFSAVGYFFGRDLLKELKIPVGLVLSAWGGSSCEAWVSAEALEEVTDFRGKGPWSSANAEDNQSPAVLYNGMIAPLIPFTFRGVLWYQGETNVGRAGQFSELFPEMIKGWRKDWNQGDFPFYFAQLAPWNGNGGSLRLLWEAQASAMSTANTGMVITLDTGEFNNIHPSKKEPVGHRFALWALAKVYGRTDLAYSGPFYKSMQIEGGKIRLAFDHSESGLKAATDPMEGFEVAGEDKIYRPASARVDGRDVLVWSDGVPEPKHARYAWSDTAKAVLYNNADLPAAPFRTDRPDYLSPVKCGISAEPAVIRQGESSMITWSVKGAAKASLNGNDVSFNGSMKVSPESNTEYVLTASGEDTIAKSVRVHVVPKNLTNIALNRPATASSVEWEYLAANAVDGNVGTRWASFYEDPQWIEIDLGESVPIERIILHWEAAFGKAYEIQVSDDLSSWKTVFKETNGNGGIDDLTNLLCGGRYVRLYGAERGTQWGYSLLEFEIYSPASPKK